MHTETNTPLVDCNIVELRQYTLHPGQRDVLIELFEREFIESQEQLGIRLLGLFRDLDAPDRFVWLRGFRSMVERADALSAFYSGPVWKQHRSAANATMQDSDNVLLLRPAHAAQCTMSGRSCAAATATPQSRGIVVATLYYFAAPVDAHFVDFFDTRITGFRASDRAVPLSRFVSEAAPNSFPQLPVRDREHVFVSLTSFDDTAAHARYAQSFATSVAGQALQQRIVRSETLRLAPTRRSSMPASQGIH